jgi:hypothetical protein
MTPEISQFIVGKRIISQYTMSEQMKRDLSLTIDNIHARLTHELVNRFTDEMIASRMKDVVIENGLPMNQTKFSLELYVFNKEELKNLIRSINQK